LSAMLHASCKYIKRVCIDMRLQGLGFFFCFFFSGLNQLGVDRYDACTRISNAKWYKSQVSINCNCARTENEVKTPGLLRNSIAIQMPQSELQKRAKKTTITLPTS
jgi:hypothetical protein